MDTTQLLLTVVLTVTTILLIIIGIQLIFILKDLRSLLKKVKSIVDELEKVGVSFEHGFSEISGFLSAIKTIFRLVNTLHNKKNGKSKQ